MLALAGIPGTVGFIGKFQLINALVSGDYTWLAIVLVIGSMISLGYYLRVVATIWMRPPVAAPVVAAASAGVAAGGGGSGGLAPIAGGSIEADEWEEGPGPAGVFAYPEIVLVAVVFAAATIFFGIFPQPLFHFTAHAANALSGLF